MTAEHRLVHLEYLHDKVRGFTLFATHHHELIDLAEKPRVCRKHTHVDVEENAKGSLFLHKIMPGGIDQSYGIEVARLAGLPAQVSGQSGWNPAQIRNRKELERKRIRKISSIYLPKPTPARRLEKSRIQHWSGSKAWTSTVWRPWKRSTPWVNLKNSNKNEKYLFRTGLWCRWNAHTFARFTVSKEKKMKQSLQNIPLQVPWPYARAVPWLRSAQNWRTFGGSSGLFSSKSTLDLALWQRSLATPGMVPTQEYENFLLSHGLQTSLNKICYSPCFRKNLALGRFNGSWIQQWLFFVQSGCIAFPFLCIGILRIFIARLKVLWIMGLTGQLLFPEFWPWKLDFSGKAGKGKAVEPGQSV